MQLDTLKRICHFNLLLKMQTVCHSFIYLLSCNNDKSSMKEQTRLDPGQSIINHQRLSSSALALGPPATSHGALGSCTLWQVPFALRLL